jgi:arginyl-tRNA synthetase
MNTLLETAIADILKELFALEGASIELQETRKEFEGDLTLVVFPFLKASRMAPDATAEAIGAQLLARLEDVESYNVVKGFLNISLSDAPVQSQFDAICSDAQWGIRPVDHSQAAAMVEYSSPNTNKPLHLGHIRNNLLGYSVAQMIQATGKPVVQVQIINDRGVHICKSMYAWQQFGNGETPETSGLKGDHLVGKYYVRFDQQLKRETEDGIAKGLSPDEAKAQAPCMLAVQKMLQDWEAGDAAVLELWNTMNQWVYAGFNATYARLGVQFDKNYYESNTYLLGKKDVEEGLANGVFYRREDGSVWIDLTADGLDEKLVLRKDGTSVYMTQDIGTAIQRFADFHMDSLTYVVGNEQDYHFKVLFLILSKLGYDWAQKLSHLSYGMVDLPSGRMKSREGTVVDADDLLDEMEATAKRLSEELGKVDGLTSEEQSALYKTLGHGALKYFILKVDPKKRMVFNPEESIDFNGNTGPFLQYTHARIQSILRKAGQGSSWDWSTVTLETKEREVIKLLAKFPGVIEHAAADQNPSAVASFLYEVAKTYNGFYQAHSVLNAETPQKAAFRVELSRQVAGVLKRGLSLLGIAAPEQM